MSGRSGTAANGWGDLNVATAGTMKDDQKGGTAVVLLHGWGAPGDDLLSLAHVLEQPRTRFFLPAGPLSEMGGGRAWWHLMQEDRPARAENDDPRSQAVHPQLKAVRSSVQGVLRTINERYKPDSLVLSGFSQGAMLSLDVALCADPPVHRVAALSGLLLADSIPALRAHPTTRPAVFMSHGRQDPILPFPAGELAKNLLQKHGFDVTWRPFDGGHEIPPAVVAALQTFLFPG